MQNRDLLGRISTLYEKELFRQELPMHGYPALREAVRVGARFLIETKKCMEREYYDQ